MSPRYNADKVDTRAAQFFNNNFGSMMLGFFGTSAYIKIAPVKEEFRGERPKAGSQMYEYKKSVMMTFNPVELAMIVESLGDVLANRVPMLTFTHKSGNYIATFQCGIGLDGESERLQVCMSKHERDYPDSDPTAEVWYEFNPTEAPTADDKEEARRYECEATVLKYWAAEAMRVSFQGAVHSSQLKPRSFSGGDGDSDYGRDDDRPRRPRRETRDDDDDNDRRPRRRKRQPRDDVDEAGDDDPPRRKKRAERAERAERDEGRPKGEDGIPF